MKKILFHLFALLLFSCQSGENNKSLIDGFSFNIPLVNDINDLFGTNVRTIQLDTLTEALVGFVNKIIKHDNSFFILSDEKRILHFDNYGKFISSIDKRGGGPGEYSRIADFSVCDRNGNTEIWICDYRSILKYALSGNDWDFIGSIDFKLIVNKFKVVSDNHILLFTGQNEEFLMLTDITGKRLDSFLKREVPYVVMRPIQFINHDSCLIFQLGISNEGVAFDTRDFSFEYVNITNNEQLLTKKDLLNLFDRFGQEYIREVPKTNSIRGYNIINGNVWVDYYYNDGHFVAISQNGVWKRMKVDNNNPSINTTFASESYDSFLRFEYPENDNLNLVLYDHLQ